MIYFMGGGLEYLDAIANGHDAALFSFCEILNLSEERRRIMLERLQRVVDADVNLSPKRKDDDKHAREAHGVGVADRTNPTRTRKNHLRVSK